MITDYEKDRIKREQDGKEKQRFDAVRAIEKMRQNEIITHEEAAELLDILGLLDIRQIVTSTIISKGWN